MKYIVDMLDKSTWINSVKSKWLRFLWNKIEIGQK
jgi:hypothetical protein